MWAHHQGDGDGQDEAEEDVGSGNVYWMPIPSFTYCMMADQAERDEAPAVLRIQSFTTSGNLLSTNSTMWLVWERRSNAFPSSLTISSPQLQLSASQYQN